MAIPSVNFTGARGISADLFSIPPAVQVFPEINQALQFPNTLNSNSTPSLRNNNLLSRNHSLRENFVSPRPPESDFSPLAALGLAGGLAGLAFFAAKKHPVFSAAILLLGLGACVDATPGIAYSKIEFNPKIAGDFRPSAQIEEKERHFFNKGGNPAATLSELYPNLADDMLEKIPTTSTFWISHNTLQERGFNLSWELILSDFSSDDTDLPDLHNERVRGCAFPFLEDPETGKAFGNPETGKTRGFITNFEEYTVGLQVCPELPEEQASILNQSCTLHDTQNFLTVDPREKRKNIGCFINGNIPSTILQGDASLSLFLADRTLQRRTALLERSTVHPLFPQIRVIESCRSFRRPLSFLPHKSGVALVNDGQGKLTPAMRLHWCWSVADGANHKAAQDVSEFFDPRLIVRGVSSCKTSSVSKNCEATPGDFVNVLLHDCSHHQSTPSSYDLNSCVNGSPLELTPSHAPDDPANILTWCLENRMFPKPDGSYPEPRWKRDEALFLEFNVCEKP